MTQLCLHNSYHNSKRPAPASILPQTQLGKSQPKREPNTIAQRDKQQVANQFSRAASSYDSAASIQQQAWQQLLALMPEVQGHWLDIGCGTGAAFSGLFDQGVGHLSGLDLSTGMLNHASAQHAEHSFHKQLELLHCDADVLPFCDNSKDGIFSSLMLQWSEDPSHTLSEWLRVLKPGGLLAYATLLPGTHIELAKAWRQIDHHPHVNRFTTLAYLQRLNKKLGVELVAEQQSCIQERYNSLTELLRSLKAIGATNVNSGRKTGLGGRAALRLLDQFYPRDGEQQLPLSYQVYWQVVRKPADA